MTPRPVGKAVASLSDGELLARVAAGEYASLAPVYDRHHEAVARFVARALGGSHDVEDIVQETFLCAARKAASFDGRLGCRPWLLGIAARQILHVRRTFARLRGMLDRYRQLDAPTPPPDPHEGASLREEHWRLERAIGRLSESKRIVLLMAEIEEMSGEQISAALGIPVGTVWTRLHHARRELRHALEEGS